MSNEQSALIQEDSCKINANLYDVCRKPPFDDKLPVMHVKEFIDNLYCSAFV